MAGQNRGGKSRIRETINRGRTKQEERFLNKNDTREISCYENPHYSNHFNSPLYGSRHIRQSPERKVKYAFVIIDYESTEKFKKKESLQQILCNTNLEKYGDVFRNEGICTQEDVVRAYQYDKAGLGALFETILERVELFEYIETYLI